MCQYRINVSCTSSWLCPCSLPTLVEPVKLIFLTSGFVASSIDASRSLVGMTCRTSFGTPASSSNFAKVRAVSLGGLMTTAQPAASAGATFRVIMAAGKFHGVMMPQTPTGSRRVNTTVLVYEDGIVSPYALAASSANQEMKDAAYLTSPSASLSVFPFSRERIVATVGLR